MALEIDTLNEPAYPVALSTLRELAQLKDRVLRKDMRTRPQRRRDAPVGLGLKKGVLDQDLTRFGTADVSVWRLNSSNVEADSGDTLEDVRAWMLASGDTIDSGTQVVCAWIEGAWYVINAACSADDGPDAPEGNGGDYMTPVVYHEDYFGEDYFHN